jgi:hypothetical protein
MDRDKKSIFENKNRRVYIPSVPSWRSRHRRRCRRGGADAVGRDEQEVEGRGYLSMPWPPCVRRQVKEPLDLALLRRGHVGGGC